MNFDQTKLKNGINVILSPLTSTRAVSVLILVKVGSRHETKKNNGISHFVEHLLFKGTKKRPSTLVISQELDSIGADYNAFTSKEKTGFYIKAESANFELIADMLSDMLTNSIFDPNEVERERGTILEEINMYEDNPMSKIGDFFEEDLFGENTALGRHVIGTKDTIKSMKQKSLMEYWAKHYNKNNIVISVAGNFNKKKVLKILEQKFSKVNTGKQNKSTKKTKIKSLPEFSAHHKKTSQAHLILGFEGLNYSHKDRYALGVLSIILGGNMSSRLFISVRERLGLCYFIRSSAETMEDTGIFSIQAGLDLKKIDKALTAISTELRDIKTNNVSSEELNKAKQFVKGKMALSQEDSLDIASFFAEQAMIRQKISTPDEVFKKIEKVSVQDIKKVANDVIKRDKVLLSTLSPFKDINKFGKFLEF
jgi:predicted Zn-dependent peptidase